MSGMWWLMAANHELEQEPVVRAPEPIAEVTPEPAIVPIKQARVACPKCGRTGRGIAIHIRNCKG